MTDDSFNIFVKQIYTCMIVFQGSKVKRAPAYCREVVNITLMIGIEFGSRHVTVIKTVFYFNCSCKKIVYKLQRL